MLGWKIFMRAVKLLLDNIGAVLRISLVPYGVVIALSIFLGVNLGDQSAITPIEGAVGRSGDLAPRFRRCGVRNHRGLSRPDFRLRLDRRRLATATFCWRNIRRAGCRRFGSV